MVEVRTVDIFYDDLIGMNRIGLIIVGIVARTVDVQIYSNHWSDFLSASCVCSEDSRGSAL